MFNDGTNPANRFASPHIRGTIGLDISLCGQMPKGALFSVDKLCPDRDSGAAKMNGCGYEILIEHGVNAINVFRPVAACV